MDCIEINGKHYLRQDTSVVCGSLHYQKFRAANLIFVAAYMSVPLSWGILLWTNKAKIAVAQANSRQDVLSSAGDGAKDPFKGVKRFMFLFRIYTPEWYFFEPLEM